MLDKSSKAMLAKSRPTNEDLRRFVEQEFETKDKTALAARFQERAFELLAAEAKQMEIMRTIDREESQQGHGWVPEEKPDGITRLVFENWNSIEY